MWRVYPKRFELVQEIAQAVTSSVEHRSVRSRTGWEQTEESGMGGGDGRDSGAAGVMAARVAGLEEEGVFRSVVMFL